MIDEKAPTGEVREVVARLRLYADETVSDGETAGIDAGTVRRAADLLESLQINLEAAIKRSNDLQDRLESLQRENPSRLEELATANVARHQLKLPES